MNKKSNRDIPTKKPWTLTSSDVTSINKIETVWGTTKFLPPEDEIPDEFWKGNIYTKLADAMWAGVPLPAGEIDIRPEFSSVPIKDILPFVMAHLKSFEPKHEHKIAGVGYIVSKMMHITAILT